MRLRDSYNGTEEDAGTIQKYKAEKAMLCASTLTNMDEVEVMADVLAMATAIAATKNDWATKIGRNAVARSAAKASEFWRHN